MMDSVPYPYNFAAYALLKGLLYNEENLNILYEEFKDLSPQVLLKTREDMYVYGNEGKFLDKTLKEWTKIYISMAENVLGEEKKYLEPLKEIIETEGSFYFKTERIYEETKNIKKAVEFNSLNRRTYARR